MSKEELNISTHEHDELLEGPLPEGFPQDGREGKVRNVYVQGDQICLIASDRVSAFDQVSPTPIPGKGEILNDIARQELEAASQVGLANWLEYVPEENPRAAVGVRADVLPVEMIFRNYMTGSMWREYRDTGDFSNFSLPNGWSEWHSFADNPLFTPSTKSDVKDVNFNPDDVEEVTGVDTETLGRMEKICRELFALGTKRAANKGLILVDTKYEVGLTSQGEMIILDEIHTPDSSRFLVTEGFEETIARGEKPKSLSKEFLREIILGRADGDLEAAKELMKYPLPDDVVAETISRYRQLHELFTA